MSRAEKLLQKFMAAKGPFKWTDLVTLLTSLGFEQTGGKGSRMGFVKGSLTIRLHRPHPQKEIKAYAVRQIQSILKDEDLL